MIINLKNSKNLSNYDLKNSYQVQWWYIHDSLVKISLEQTHTDNIAYYLDNQCNTLKYVPSESEFFFGEDLPKRITII